MKIKRDIALSDNGFIFNPSTGDSYSVNPLGLQIIRLLQSGKSFEDLKAGIMESFDVDEATFEKDYYDFMKMMDQFRLTEA